MKEDTSLLVSERFVSLQGEGITAGMPSAFLRLARCNLACAWCDTPYSWDFDRYDFDQEVTRISVEELVRWSIEVSPGRLVVTGGEPLVQHKPLSELLTRVRQKSDSPPVIEVETNATVRPTAQLIDLVDQFNVSPKLSGSGESEPRRLKPAVLELFAGLPSANFKFVVSSEEEAGEAIQLVERYQVSHDRVLFMPEARLPDELRRRRGAVAGWALSHRVRFSDRLHLELFGGRRGS